MIHGKTGKPGVNQCLYLRCGKVHTDKTDPVKMAHPAVLGIIAADVCELFVDECDLASHLFGLLLKCIQNQYKERMSEAASAFLLIDDPEPDRGMIIRFHTAAYIVLHHITAFHLSPPSSHCIRRYREIKVHIRVRLLIQRKMPPLTVERKEVISHHRCAQEHPVFILILRNPPVAGM